MSGNSLVRQAFITGDPWVDFCGILHKQLAFWW